MKKAVVIMSLVFIFVSTAVPVFASQNLHVPKDILDYAQSLCDGQIAELIEKQFISNKKENTRIYRNSKPGDDYHLSEPKKIYNISGDVDTSDKASMKISSIINEVEEGYFYTVDNSDGDAVVILEMCRESDGKPGFSFGDDAYFFQKCYQLMSNLMKKDNLKTEPMIIDEITLGLYAVDSDGTERIMPIPWGDEDRGKILSVTSIKQLPTGEELYSDLQERKRASETSGEILYGADVFSELSVHMDSDFDATKTATKNQLTLFISLGAVVLLICVCIFAVLKKKKTMSFHQE